MATLFFSGIDRPAHLSLLVKEHAARMIWLSPLLLEVLAEGADCAIGVSGGKDSQATLITVVAWLRAQGYAGKIFAIFADLGRAEWLQTRSFIERLCQSLEIELIVVQRAQGDLLDLIEQRRETLADTALSFNQWFCRLLRH
jgi:tRNA(Ile)-lysidine synthase TilS/MesJ